MKSEVRLVDGIMDAEDVARLIECEAGLELPGDVLPVIGGDIAAGLPGVHDAIQRGRVVDFAMDGRRLHAIDANARDAEVAREIGVLSELGDVLRLIVGVDQLLAPEIRGDAAERQVLVPAC